MKVHRIKRKAIKILPSAVTNQNRPTNENPKRRYSSFIRFSNDFADDTSAPLTASHTLNLFHSQLLSPTPSGNLLPNFRSKFHRKIFPAEKTAVVTATASTKAALFITDVICTWRKSTRKKVPKQERERKTERGLALSTWFDIIFMLSV